MRWIAAAAVGVAMMIAGCRKPYQAEATLIGDARYMIRSAPEGEQHSESIATQAAHRRAKRSAPTATS